MCTGQYSSRALTWAHSSNDQEVVISIANWLLGGLIKLLSELYKLGLVDDDVHSQCT